MRALTRILSVLLLVLLALPVWLLGCGRNKDSTAPYFTTIAINPSSLTIKDTSLTAPTHHTELYTITVKDSFDNPMNKVKVTISYVWAVPDYYGVVQLYDTSGTPVNSPFEGVTDDYGVYNFKMVFDSGGGLAYKADIEVRSGTAFKSSTFEVKNQ